MTLELPRIPRSVRLLLPPLVLAVVGGYLAGSAFASTPVAFTLPDVGEVLAHDLATTDGGSIVIDRLADSGDLCARTDTGNGGAGGACIQADSNLPMLTIYRANEGAYHLVVLDPRSRIGAVRAVAGSTEVQVQSATKGLSAELSISAAPDTVQVIGLDGQVLHEFAVVVHPDDVRSNEASGAEGHH